MPYLRQRSLTGIPASASFKIATIWLSVMRLLIVKLLCFSLKEILRVGCIILRGSYKAKIKQQTTPSNIYDDVGESVAIKTADNTLPPKSAKPTTPPIPRTAQIRLVKMPHDLDVNPKGVYGYLPKKESQLHSSKWPVDWTDKRQVEKARSIRLNYHEELEQKKQLVNSLRSAKMNDEDIARTLVEKRNSDRLAHYKTPESLDAVYKRNLEKYGSKTGPTYESQLVQYGTPEGVINASLRSNDTVDILTGIATPR